MTTTARRYNLNEDFQDDFALTKRAGATSDRTEAGGLTLAARFCTIKENPDGTPPTGIAGLTFTVTELSGEAGTYRVECDKSQTSVVLLPYRRRTLYLILSNNDMDCVHEDYLITGNREIED